MLKAVSGILQSFREAEKDRMHACGHVLPEYTPTLYCLNVKVALLKVASRLVAFSKLMLKLMLLLLNFTGELNPCSHHTWIKGGLLDLRGFLQHCLNRGGRVLLLT